MMRTALLVMCLMVVSGGMQLLRAQPEATRDRSMGRKWARGVRNTVVSVTEIPAQTSKGYENGIEGVGNQTGSKVGGAALGLAKGVWYGVGRLGYGITEMATFWAVEPENNVGVGYELSEYPWGVPDTQSELAARHRRIAEEEEAEAPVDRDTLRYKFGPARRKLVRGSVNTVLGPAEIPYSIRHAQVDEERTMVGSVGRGLWFWSSRLVNGLTETVTFVLPNPEDRVGEPYRHEEPWSNLTPIEKKEVEKEAAGPYADVLQKAGVDPAVNAEEEVEAKAPDLEERSGPYDHILREVGVEPPKAKGKW